MSIYYKFLFWLLFFKSLFKKILDFHLGKKSIFGKQKIVELLNFALVPYIGKENLL